MLLTLTIAKDNLLFATKLTDPSSKVLQNNAH